MNRSKGMQGKLVAGLALAAVMALVAAPGSAEARTLKTTNRGQGTLNCYWDIDNQSFEVRAGQTHTKTAGPDYTSVYCRHSGIIDARDNPMGMVLCRLGISPYTCCRTWSHAIIGCSPNMDCHAIFSGHGDGKCEAPDAIE